MDKNNWMTSEGLDLDMTVLGLANEDKMIVSWGEITGKFISYSKKENRLLIEINAIPNLFQKLENGPLKAQILLEPDVYTISWASYNYAVRNIGDKLTITIEEKT